jgi:hypothetical protein
VLGKYIISDRPMTEEDSSDDQDEAVLEAVSVFIDHAGILIEQGGPMVLLFEPSKNLLAAVDNRASPHRSSTNQKCKTTQRRTP